MLTLHFTIEIVALDEQSWKMNLRVNAEDKLVMVQIHSDRERQTISSICPKEYNNKTFYRSQ